MPMTGIFANHSASGSMGGVIALEVWCLYFLPIGILSYFHLMVCNVFQDYKTEEML